MGTMSSLVLRLAYVKAAGIAVPKSVFFMSLLNIPPFQKRAFEVKMQLVRSYLEFALDWYPVTHELVISPGKTSMNACKIYNIENTNCRMTSPFWWKFQAIIHPNRPWGHLPALRLRKYPNHQKQGQHLQKRVPPLLLSELFWTPILSPQSLWHVSSPQ